MPTVAICSDTHVPSRAPEVPDWVLEELRDADHVVHAGDFDAPEAYEAVADAATDLTAVRGNMDPPGLDVPDVATLSVGGVAFVVTHGTGPVDGYRERVAGIVADEAPADADRAIGVAGHTHEVMDEELRGHRVLNPGSATGAAPAARTTMMVAEVEDGDVEVELLDE